MLAAVSRAGGVLRYTVPGMRGDKPTVLAAVGSDGMALQHALRELQADEDVVLAAVKNNGHALEYASSRIKCEAGDRKNPQWDYVGDLWCCKNGDKEVVLAAVKNVKQAAKLYAMLWMQDNDVERAYYDLPAENGPQC